jgi:hypothetical protein
MLTMILVSRNSLRRIPEIFSLGSSDSIPSVRMTMVLKPAAPLRSSLARTIARTMGVPWNGMIAG